jgi:hypothetical protein
LAEETMKRPLLTLTFLLLSLPLPADEGMWTLENFPAARVLDEYGVTIDRAWLERVRDATTRLGGCTGSFVSPQGLILTNHHCVSRCLGQLSSAEEDVSARGFLAASPEQEAPCTSDHVLVLKETEDITAQIEAATAGKKERDANEIRKKTLTRLEKECVEASKLTETSELVCESESLYNGGQYFLYKYKRYKDVRLVFAPEDSVAAFGGDPDNFNFPRWCLDMAFLRAYEDGRPAETPNYLSWRPEGPEAGEPLFVSGHPGSTERLLTIAELKWLRDVKLPLWLLRYSELRGRYVQFGKTSEESARRIQRPLLQIENSIKVRRNELKALLNDQLLSLKDAEERALRELVQEDPEMNAAYGSAWEEIESANRRFRVFYEEYLFLEEEAAFNGSLFKYARDLVRAATERERPNEERLREYRETALPRLEQTLLASRPVYLDVEELRLSFSLEKMREWLGPDSPYVKKILGNDSPDAKAKDLVAGSRLGDPKVRKALWEGGRKAIEASEDSMIRLARLVDDDARTLRKRYENEVEAPQEAASEKIARARFAIRGTNSYPDATFSLRMSFGAVAGWNEKGEKIEPFTTLGRIYDRATGERPFRLPASWLELEAQLNPATRFNFVATTDITGGNSGSPLIDKDGNLVGLAFDGNIHSIGGAYWFDQSMNRTVSVHPAAMLEALDVVYGADHLLEELGLTGAVDRAADGSANGKRPTLAKGVDDSR